MPRAKRQHAVVVGGSVAGLLAARALADHYDSVTVLDRDPEAGSTASPRTGVPQGRHLHALLRSGLHVLDDFFPGFSQDLCAAGGVEIDTGAFLWRGPYGWLTHVPDPEGRFTAISATRPLIEHVIARRVAALPNVTIRPGATVTGLLADGKTVAGVTVTAREGDTTAEELAADLVVDASGRGSHAPTWLAELGFTAPAETLVDAHLVYATRLVRGPDDALGGARAVFITPVEGGVQAGGAALRVEDGQWIITFAGVGDHAPKRDDDAFLPFAEALPDPALAQLLRASEPVSPVVTHRGTSNRRRHFERLTRHPTGLLVFGDALCAFNPIYGQGMSVAALCAARLADALRRDVAPDQLSRRLYREFRTASQPAWSIATGGDLAVETTDGVRPPGMGVVTPYMDAVQRAACSSVLVRRQFLEVAQLMKPAQSLFAPHVIAAVALASASPRRRRQGQVRPAMLPAVGVPTPRGGPVSAAGPHVP